VLAGAALAAPWPARGGEADGGADPAPPEAERPALTADSGVAVQTVCTNCNNADLSLGALGNDHVAMICDGQPVPPGLAQIYLLAIMPASMLDRITVHKGACRAEYEGGAVGGGLALERRPIRPGLRVNASTDLGDFGWRGNKLDLTARRGRTGGYFVWSSARSSKIDADGDGFASLPEFDRTTYEAGVEFEPGRRHRLRLSTARYEEAQREGQAAYNAIYGPGFEGYNAENVVIDRAQYDATYEWSAPGRSTLALTGSWAERSENIDETEAPYPGPFAVCSNLLDPLGALDTFCPAYLIDDTRRHAGVRWSRPVGTQARISAGAAHTESAYDVVDVKYNAAGGLPALFQLEETVREDGLWAEGQTALGAEFDLTVGARYVSFDYEDNEAALVQLKPQRAPWLDIPLPEGSKLVPRGALTWKPAEAWNLRLSAGAGFRAPTPAFSEVCCGRRYRGNRGLELESSTSLGLEATYQPSPRVRVGASAFRTDFDDLIVHMITLGAGARTYQYANVPEARKSSLTVDGRFEGPAWLTTRVSWSWLRADNRTPGDLVLAVLEFPIDVPQPTTFSYDRIPTAIDRRGAVGLDLRLPHALSATIDAQYTGPAHIQALDAPPDPNLGGSTLDTTALFETDGFFAVNVTLRKEFKGGLDLFAGVDNAFDEIQADLGDPNFDTNWGLLRGRYVYGGLGYHFDSQKK